MAVPAEQGLGQMGDIRSTVMCPDTGEGFEMCHKNESPEEAQAWPQALGPSQGIQGLMLGNGAWLPSSFLPRHDCISLKG